MQNSVRLNRLLGAGLSKVSANKTYARLSSRTAGLDQTLTLDARTTACIYSRQQASSSLLHQCTAEGRATCTTGLTDGLCRLKTESVDNVSTCKPLVGSAAHGVPMSPFDRHALQQQQPPQQQQQQQFLLQSMLAHAAQTSAQLPVAQPQVVTPFASKCCTQICDMCVSNTLRSHLAAVYAVCQGG